MKFLIAGLILVVAVKSASSQPLEHCYNCKCCVGGSCADQERCIFGCIEGTAGNKCWVACPSYCKGCTREAEWAGLTYARVCTSCVDGKYVDQAKNCSSCPAHCKTCKSETVCNECVHPYYNSGDVTNCSLSCPGNCECISPGICSICKDGFYDLASNCTEKCSSNCVSCNSPYDCAECFNGFYNGYVEDNLETLQFNNCSLECRPTCTACSSYDNCSSCAPGKHGHSCLNNCSIGCKGNMCDKDTGRCSDCETYFQGDRCDVCTDYYFTADCSRLCPSFRCKNPTCNRHNGTCSQCNGGLFGEFCNNTCSPGCMNNSCIQASGLCSYGCIPSFTGDKCCTYNGHCKTCLSNSECKTCTEGYYGNKCDMSCTDNCKDGCERTQGQCVNCKAGKYGPMCEQNCSATCDSSCNRHSGLCSFGCIVGYHGKLCNDSCHGNCMDNKCHQNTGHCLQCVDGFEGTACSERITKSSIVGPVAGGVTGFVVVVAVLVGVFFFMKRRRRRNNHKEPSTAVTEADNETFSNEVVRADERMSANENADVAEATPMKEELTNSLKLEELDDEVEDIGDGNEIPVDQANCYYNVTPAIKVTAFCDYVMKKSTDLFREEFARLPKQVQNPCTFAKRPENIQKNRYNGIYPYDHSRVTIDGEPDFFMNACYINGFEKEKRYIASLGPTKKTTEDFKSFWKMVWNERSDVILMLTHLHEISGMKCEQYWPELNQSIQYGEVMVTCDKDSAFAEHTIRTFAVSKNSQKRNLTQIHYTAWPDKDVPDNVTSLVELRQRVTEATRETKGPIIVHCSAGVGRTGTYIALDKLIEEGEKTGSVNVWGCVISMREQRVNMVQTPDQYVFLHKALAYSLTTECKPIRAERFFDTLSKMTPVTYEKQLQQLTCIKEDISEEEKKAVVTNESHNVDKNRSGADIPGDRYRPRLHLNRTFNDSDYINATHIDSYTESDHFIITQTPLRKTVKDFLELAYQTNCSCIVSLGQSIHSAQDVVGTYLPTETNSIKEGNFTVTCVKSESTGGYTKSQITIKNTGKPSAGLKTLQHFEYNNWTEEDNAPKDTDEFVKFVNAVESHSDTVKDQTTPIMVHCLYAGKRSGLFCAVTILREKLQIENQVSVVNTVRQIQNRRKSAIGNKEQLEFCYRCIATLLESSNIYANFTGNFAT